MAEMTSFPCEQEQLPSALRRNARLPDAAHVEDVAATGQRMDGRMIGGGGPGGKVPPSDGPARGRWTSPTGVPDGTCRKTGIGGVHALACGPTAPASRTHRDPG